MENALPHEKKILFLVVHKSAHSYGYYLLLSPIFHCDLIKNDKIQKI